MVDINKCTPARSRYTERLVDNMCLGRCIAMVAPTSAMTMKRTSQLVNRFAPPSRCGSRFCLGRVALVLI